MRASRCCSFSAGPKAGCELEQGLVEAASRCQLHAADGTGNSDRWYSSEAEGSGVTQEADARFTVIRAGGEARNGCAGEQEHLVLGEQIVHARLKAE